MFSIPGQRTIDSGVTPREILMSDEGKIVLPGPIIIDSAVAIDGKNTSRTDELRAGCLMAQNTASGKWAPLKRTTVLSGGGSSVTTCVLTESRFFKVGDLITIGADDVTILTIDYTTDTITFAAKTIADGEAVISRGTAGAGYETCKGILQFAVRLQSGEPYISTLYDKTGTILAGGYVNQDFVLGDLTAARADTAARLSAFIWSDRQQNA